MRRSRRTLPEPVQWALSAHPPLWRDDGLKIRWICNPGTKNQPLPSVANGKNREASRTLSIFVDPAFAPVAFGGVCALLSYDSVP